tara:strand:- start:35369 stop:36643 length:1275 start_codon:yes stop_codon:yes gene_type:complete
MSDLKWTTESRKIKDLVPYEYNPRKLTESRKAKLQESLQYFDLAEIPAINLDNVIIAGHQRIKVLMEMGRGEEMIDVRVPSRQLTEVEFKKYNITSNLPTGFWDRDILDEAFGDIDLAALGLDVDNIEVPDTEEVLIDLVNEEEGEVDPEPRKNVISVLGDLYEFQSISKKISHRIHCADSRDSDAVAKLLNGNKLDLVHTDPPYNVDYTGGTKEALKIQNDKMSSDKFYLFLYEFYVTTSIFMKEGAAFYIWHADSEGHNFRGALINAGLKLAQCLIWVKNSMVMGRQDYQWKHEPVLYGWKPGAAHQWCSDRKQTTVLNFDKPLRNADHPTMKPLDMCEYLIKNSAKRGQNVYDGFAGSGTTTIACEKLRINSFAQELGPEYVDVIIRRYINYMRENKLSFNILRNGKTLSDVELDEYFKEG